MKELTPDMKFLIEQIQEFEIVVNQEKMDRVKVECSDAYIALNKKEERIRQQKLALLENLTDHSNALLAHKTTLMAIMEREMRETAGPYRGKYKEKKEVKTEKVLDVLQGDLSHFLKLAKITQVDLKALARTEGGNKEKALLECVEVTERKLIDLELATPER